MPRVHILSSGFDSPNAAAFIFPLIRYKRKLQSFGIEWFLFRGITPTLTDCDVLIIESKFYKSGWGEKENETLEEISRFRDAGPTVLFFDTGDSTGWLKIQVLPVVDGYRKSQLLKNRDLYLTPMYGKRSFTHYYFENCGVQDSNPIWSDPILHKSHLGKLGLSWNSGLADYSLYGPFRMKMYHKFPWSGFLQFPSVIALADQDRRSEVSCRFGIEYSRQSVAWQRRAVRDLLSRRIPTQKLSRRRYFNELKDSKVVISPFGWGEINYKDYEVFLTGGLLMKPDMSHLETWPDLFRDKETICTFDWDLKFLEERLNHILQDGPKRVEIAKQGQDTYERYLGTDEGSDAFCKHFISTLQPQPSQ